jgi:hypothetical protein
MSGRRRVEIGVSAIGLGGAALFAWATKLADLVSIYHLPNDLRELLFNVSRVPDAFAYALVAVGTAGLAFLLYDTMQNRQVADASERSMGPKIGSLRYINAIMKIGHYQSTNVFSGQIIVEISNDSDNLIYFTAETAGSINGIAFDNNKVTFDGYIFPRQTTSLYSARIIGIPVTFGSQPDKPSFLGIYEFDIRYRFADEKEFSRRSTRGIRIENWTPYENKPVGNKIEIPVNVVFYNHIEE